MHYSKLEKVFVCEWDNETLLLYYYIHWRSVCVHHSSPALSHVLALSLAGCIRNHRMPYNGKYHKRKSDARNKMSWSLYNDSMNVIAIHFFLLDSGENCTRSKEQRTVSMFRSACIPLIFCFFSVMFQTNFEHTHTHFALLYHVSIHAQRKRNFSHRSLCVCGEWRRIETSELVLWICWWLPSTRLHSYCYRIVCTHIRSHIIIIIISVMYWGDSAYKHTHTHSHTAKSCLINSDVGINNAQ